jgi:hypothetical protein
MGNPGLTILLFAVAFIALSIQWLVNNRLTFSGRGQLMISIDQASFTTLEAKLTAFLKERLRGLTLQTMSVLEDRVSLHYQYRRRMGFNWIDFTRDLNQIASPAKVDIFIG